MVEEVMGKVVAYVAKYPATEDCGSNIPVPEKDGMS